MAQAHLHKLEGGTLEGGIAAEGTAEGTATGTRGGVREGAGRKPKALRHASEIATAEAHIVSAMPELISQLIEAAKGGDVSAAKYLLDRVLGRVAAQAAPLADDRTLPMMEHDVEMLEKRAAVWRKEEEDWAALGQMPPGIKPPF